MSNSDRFWYFRKERYEMGKIPVYICNHKRCMVCYRTLCGRTVDKEYAELDERGEPIVAAYYDDEKVNLEEVEK